MRKISKSKIEDVNKEESLDRLSTTVSTQPTLNTVRSYRKKSL